MTKLYSPPEGYIDLPFTWAYDGSGLTNGLNYLNQNVYLLGGYGDFIMRRVVGLDRLLAAGSGLYQLKDRNNKEWQSLPVIVDGSSELMIVPEQPYPETGLIRFDLYDIQKPAVATSAQLAFQGVRRIKSSAPPIKGKVDPRTFTYIMTADLSGVTAGGIIRGRVQVVDYPFLLEQLMVFTEDLATTEFAEEASATLTFAAANLGASGNLISVTLDAIAPNQALSIVVAGDAITIFSATDGLSTPLTTGNQLLALWNATAAATNLATLTVVAGGASPLPVISASSTTNTFSGGGFLNQISTPQVAMTLFDDNKVATSNIPILDIYMDGSPGGVHDNGAVVTPLPYRKDSQIYIDFTLLTTPLVVVVYLVGKQIYPC